MRMLGLGLVAVLATALVPATPAGVEAAQKAQKDRAATMTAIALAESRKKKGLKTRTLCAPVGSSKPGARC